MYHSALSFESHIKTTCCCVSNAGCAYGLTSEYQKLVDETTSSFSIKGNTQVETVCLGSLFSWDGRQQQEYYYAARLNSLLSLVANTNFISILKCSSKTFISCPEAESYSFVSCPRNPRCSESNSRNLQKLCVQYMVREASFV